MKNIPCKQELLEYLSEFLTSQKKEKIQRVLSFRTRHITLLLENVFQSHNANAIIRTADCFGIQDIHVVQDKNKFAADMSISRGATQWVDLYRYKNTEEALAHLKAQDYMIVATSPDAKINLDELAITKKTVLLFGTEKAGLSDYAQQQADQLIKIPMYGFTQSFNVSVSVALCLQHCIRNLYAGSLEWHVSEEEKIDIQLQWAHKIIPAAKQLEEKFLCAKGQIFLRRS